MGTMDSNNNGWPAVGDRVTFTLCVIGTECVGRVIQRHGDTVTVSYVNDGRLSSASGPSAAFTAAD